VGADDEAEKVVFGWLTMAKWKMVLELEVEAEDEEDAVDEFVRKVNELHNDADLDAFEFKEARKMT